MPVLQLIKKVHLYLSLFCLPWFVMYGLTSLAFTHPNWFNDGGDFHTTQGVNWTKAGAWSCTLPIPEGEYIPYNIATQLVHIAGMDAKAYGAYWSGPNQVSVYFPDFWSTQRLTYDIDQEQLSLFTRRTPSQHVLSGMHARAGYQHKSIMDDFWAIMVDFVMFSFILWVITGLYIWLQSKQVKVWGIAGLISGLLSFILFMFLL